MSTDTPMTRTELLDFVRKKWPDAPEKEAFGHVIESVLNLMDDKIRSIEGTLTVSSPLTVQNKLSANGGLSVPAGQKLTANGPVELDKASVFRSAQLKADAAGVCSGSDYLGVKPPAKGLLVEGPVALGKQAAKCALDIAGQVNADQGVTTSAISVTWNNAKAGVARGEFHADEHGVRIGASYAAGSSAPANGIIVEGAVCVGTTVTGNNGLPKLRVSGKLEPLSGGAEFAHEDGSCAITVGSQGIAATGAKDDQNVRISTKGEGYVSIENTALIGETLKLSNAWSGWPEVHSGKGAEICNDLGQYKALMLAGNNVSGRRQVHVYDDLKVNGHSTFEGSAHIKGPAYIEGNLCYFWNVKDGTKGWYAIGNRDHGYAGSEYMKSQPQLSDARFKTELGTIQGALDLVRHLRGVRYRWNERGLSHFTRDIEDTVSAGPSATAEENQRLWDLERERFRSKHGGAQVGLIAQEVEQAVPEVVRTDREGYKSLDYGHLTAVLIEAVKEQQGLIDDLRSRLATLEGARTP